MNKTNYALITALYDTKGADLYNDVYFPIIKYEIVNQYYTQTDIEKYYDLEELQSLINTDFGIVIPCIILKQSIKAIGLQENGISLSVYENGKQFKIKKAWDISITLSIDNKSQEISSKFDKLNILYKQYLDAEGLSYEKSFIDFYSDHTEEILTHIDGVDEKTLINEGYVNLTRFLFWLKESNIELYNIANDIFWGSIIAGFLKRNKTDINIKSSDCVEYFLDSSLVLAALDLDNIDNVKYAQELLEIIINSGNTPKIHALTIREINYILSSVEKEQGPRPNTAIEDAYHRRNLSPSKILQIRNNLNKLISDKGIVIFPVSENELDKIEVEYKNKHSVKELEKFRKKNYNNGIRDIHDVYLRDFIAKKRKGIVSIEKINAYFVSLNSDLISYFSKQDTLPLLLHPAKIVIDLWIHNSHSSLIKKNGLTEVMSRCFALNNTDIRRKLRLVSKYYKESDETYSQDNYQAVYTALIKRSTKAIHEVNYIIKNEQEDIDNKEEVNRSHIQALIKIAVDEELSKQQKNIELSEKLTKLEEAVKEASKTVSVSNIKSAEDEKTIQGLQAELEKQKGINKIKEEIDFISKKISQMEIEKDKSICLIKFYLILFLECIFFMGFILCIILLIISYCNTKSTINFETYVSENLWLIIGFCVSAIGFTVRTVQQLYTLSPKIKYEDVKAEQINYWIKKHPDYNELKEKFKELRIEKKRLSN